MQPQRSSPGQRSAAVLRTAAPKSTERHPGDPATALTKPSEASARARRRSRDWASTRGTATRGFTFLPAWHWKAAGEAQSGSLPSPRCTWYSGPALQDDTAGGCSQGERAHPPSPGTPRQLGPRRLPGSEGLGRRARGLVLRQPGQNAGGRRAPVPPPPRDAPRPRLPLLFMGRTLTATFTLVSDIFPAPGSDRRAAPLSAGGGSDTAERQRPCRARGRRAGAGGEGDRGRERGREGTERRRRVRRRGGRWWRSPSRLLTQPRAAPALAADGLACRTAAAAAALPIPTAIFHLLLLPPRRRECGRPGRRREGGERRWRRRATETAERLRSGGVGRLPLPPPHPRPVAAAQGAGAEGCALRGRRRRRERGCCGSGIRPRALPDSHRPALCRCTSPPQRHRPASLYIEFPWGKERNGHNLPRKKCYSVRGCSFDKICTT